MKFFLSAKPLYWRHVTDVRPWVPIEEIPAYIEEVETR